MPESVGDPCAYARERHLNLLRWRNLWTILLFVFGAAIVIVLTLTIAFASDGKFIQSVATAVGTVASGIAIKWVLDRRTDAVSEEQAAFDQMLAICKPVADEAGPSTVRRQQYRLFGRWL
jgi:hypothetical protein